MTNRPYNRGAHAPPADSLRKTLFATTMQYACFAALLCCSTAAHAGSYGVWHSGTKKLIVYVDDGNGYLEIGASSGNVYLDDADYTQATYIIEDDSSDPDYGLNVDVDTDDVEELEVIGTSSGETIDCSDVEASDYTSLESIVIYGYAGSDTITGTQLDDVIYGGTGTDNIDTEAGDDLVGDDIWVDSTLGSDLNEGTVVGSPLKSIQIALDMATDGSHIWIRGNGRVYYEGLEMYEKLGTSSNRIVIEGWDISSSLPEINGDTSTPADGVAELPNSYKGFAHTPTKSGLGLLHVEDCKHLTIKNLAIKDSRFSGITVLRTDDSVSSIDVEDIIIENCHVSYTRSFGMLVAGLTHPAPTSWSAVDDRLRNVHIRHNTLTEVTRHGSTANSGITGEAMHVDNCVDFEVHGNSVSEFYKEGILINHDCKDGKVYDNLVGSRSSGAAYTGTQGAGIYLDAFDSLIGDYENIAVYENYIFGKGPGMCINAESSGWMDDITVYNNVVNTEGYCLCLGNYLNDRTNVRILNNTFVQSDDEFDDQYVIAITETDQSTLDGFEFKNNIVAKTFDGTTRLFNIGLGVAYDSSYMTIDNNVYWDGGASLNSNGYHGTNQKPDDPKFTNSSSFSVGGQDRTSAFSIDTTASPASSAHNTGLNLSEVTHDITGSSRPGGSSNDIGAFEP